MYAAIRHSLAVVGAWALASQLATAQQAPTPILSEADAKRAIGATLSRLVRGAIPLEYEKQKDWGATTEIAVLRTEGKGFRTQLKMRKRAVKHGLWKHYRLRLVEPESNLRVELAELGPSGPGRAAFRLIVRAQIDAWARAKAYKYGIHLIALELESDLSTTLTLDGELGIEMRVDTKGPALAATPIVTAAQLEINKLDLRRVSDAHGPIVHQLGEGIRGIVEDELNGAKLVAKLNRAIEKHQDRLIFRPDELLDTSWWPTSAEAPRQ
jgi:hypothetical protein